jgi:hypothetical protein
MVPVGPWRRRPREPTAERSRPYVLGSYWVSLADPSPASWKTGRRSREMTAGSFHRHVFWWPLCLAHS